MADMSKQRLIGALLVLSVILISAVLLVKNANDNIEETAEISLPDFQSSVETTDDEEFDAAQEALIDPHGLGDDVVAIARDKTETAIVSAEKEADKVAVKASHPEQIPAAPSKLPVVIPVIKKAEPIKKTAPIIQAKSPEKVIGPQWLIQVASFSVKDNAEALQKKVKILGYQGHIQALKNSQDKMIYRLRIGPEADRQKVDLIVSKMQQHLQLKPQVIKLP